MTDTGSRVFSDAKLVVASHNQGKVTEICDLLEPLGITAISAAELGLPEPDPVAERIDEHRRLMRYEQRAVNQIRKAARIKK